MRAAPSKLWIYKPAASSQGRGIKIIKSCTDELPQCRPGHTCVVSEYIKDPLLFNGFKFDLRIYVAITSINPLRIYIYEEGLTRFATCPYKTDPMDPASKRTKKFMHLTNFSINKKSRTYAEPTLPPSEEQQLGAAITSG